MCQSVHVGWCECVGNCDRVERKSNELHMVFHTYSNVITAAATNHLDSLRLVFTFRLIGAENTFSAFWALRYRTPICPHVICACSCLVLLVSCIFSCNNTSLFVYIVYINTDSSNESSYLFSAEKRHIWIFSKMIFCFAAAVAAAPVNTLISHTILWKGYNIRPISWSQKPGTIDINLIIII